MRRRACVRPGLRRQADRHIQSARKLLVNRQRARDARRVQQRRVQRHHRYMAGSLALSARSIRRGTSPRPAHAIGVAGKARSQPRLGETRCLAAIRIARTAYLYNSRRRRANRKRVNQRISRLDSLCAAASTLDLRSAIICRATALRRSPDVRRGSRGGRAISFRVQRGRWRQWSGSDGLYHDPYQDQCIQQSCARNLYAPARSRWRQPPRWP